MGTLGGFCVFSARCVRQNESAPYCYDVHLSVCLSVCLSGTGVHCDHMMHFCTDLSLWLGSPMFWTSWHQSMSNYSQLSFSSSTWKRDGVRVYELGKELNANNDK